VVTIGTEMMHPNVNLNIQVPAATSLTLKTINNGEISVDGVSGEVDANDLNGKVTLLNISGTVVAHSLNGSVLVTMNQVDPQKPMSFSTLNGDIDVTLPAGTKAKVKMKSDNGDIYSDFDIALDASARQPKVETAPKGKGVRHRMQFDRAMYGTINGGGPEMQFTTMNGKIFIRKK
jgi:DUF4097 and DUF4098 domain-containing protein YvlB